VSRRSSFAILGVSAAIVIGCALFVLVGITGGLWQPRGAPVQTPRPGSGLGGIQLGARTYDRFIDDVRDGRVVHAYQQGQYVQVETSDDGYTVEAPAGADVAADIRAAADAGGVEPPPFDADGLEPRTISYEEFLEEVRAGRISDVTHQGMQLQASGSSGGGYVIDVPSPETDVLGDIENAARAGGVQPPYYQKVPGG
jgi:hypothetical protein